MRGQVSKRTIFAFIGPAVFGLAIVGIAPLLYAGWTSLHFFNLIKLRQVKFIGLDNYWTVLTDEVFWQAMGRTFFLLCTALPLQLAFGLGIALVLHKPGLTILKTLARLSLVNQLLGGANINWIGDPTNAFVMIIFWDVWQWTPFVALVLLAGLTMVPGEVEEAARLETKSAWKVLRYVQLPFLLPGLVAVLILRTADTLKLFDMVFTLTRGGPGAATEFISLMIQRVGFRGFDQGLASAQAIILLIITIILAQIYIRVFYKEV